MENPNKVLVIGSSGFIGRNIVSSMADSVDCEVYGACRSPDSESDRYVDMTDVTSIDRLVTEVKPNIILNCAGIVDNGPGSVDNVGFTKNLLSVLELSNLSLKNVIIMGSAAEYGVVLGDDPVSEDQECQPVSIYGESKLTETRLALDYKRKLPITIARLFNPLGPGMASKFLLPRLIEQVQEVRRGERLAIEISRLDSVRDYLDVRDMADAVRLLALSTPSSDVYNIGSGCATSNEEIIRLILDNSKNLGNIPIVETTSDKELPLASRADITRIQEEYGWRPMVRLKDTVKEVMYGSKH